MDLQGLLPGTSYLIQVQAISYWGQKRLKSGRAQLTFTTKTTGKLFTFTTQNTGKLLAFTSQNTGKRITFTSQTTGKLLTFISQTTGKVVTFTTHLYHSNYR